MCEHRGEGQAFQVGDTALCGGPRVGGYEESEEMKDDGKKTEGGEMD